MAAESTKMVLEQGNGENVYDKKVTVTERLQKREEERIADLMKRKEEKDSVSAVNESTDFFVSKFTTAKSDVESLLKESDHLEKSMMSSHFDNIQSSFQMLQKFASDNAVFLPVYEVQKAQDVITKLQNSIAEKREELIPKKKFSFSSKKKATEKEAKDNLKKEEKKMREVVITECSFADMNGQSLKKEASDLNGKDVELARLNDCTILFTGSPGTLVMDNLTKCRVFCGPISGSIFIDGCKDCTFVLACQQLRIHTTTDSKFYIHVTSKAIVEDCDRVQFAPYNWNYGELEEHYQLSGLDRNRNNWDDVDDFNWLASDKRSPHWSVLPDEERVSSWNL